MSVDKVGWSWVLKQTRRGCGRDIVSGSKGGDKWCLIVVWVVILDVVLLARI